MCRRDVDDKENAPEYSYNEGGGNLFERLSTHFLFVTTDFKSRPRLGNVRLLFIFSFLPTRVRS